MWISILALLALAITLLYHGKPWLAWVAPLGIVFAWWWSNDPTMWAFGLLGSIAGILALVTGVPALRRPLLTKPLMPIVGKMMPAMSETERIALEAGTVWWDADLFSGAPNWHKLTEFKVKGLSEREQAFLDGPVEKACAMVTDYETTEAGDLPEEVWNYLRDEGFLGMIISEKYGGLGFSHIAHSAVVTKMASRSIALSVTVMVPNSLGPAELLQHYGTDEQKNYWLPRLAKGQEIPSFALTEPGAGSDATSMTSSGVVCKGQWEGEEVIGLRLNWDKRYITLSSMATVLGLAFRMSDPDHLLGERVDLGITCALVPANLDGIEIGARHDPLGAAFHNGPTKGRDVFVPIDAIIGGAEAAGKGWLMLMQTLAAGRGISLPSMSVGAIELATRTTGAYATVREQFGLPIGRFEGIEEPLTKIGGLNYVMDAARTLTVGSIDAGEKPSVLTAVMKRYTTEGMRTALNEAMDICAGAGICRGPKNILAGAYTALPIAITVEGANILTRSMIIFGQGAIRCHPHAQSEIEAIASRDLKLFDKHFWGHVGFICTNAARSLVLGATGGRFTQNPVGGRAGEMFGPFTRMSAAFAFTADIAMGTLGGTLKFREKITGRLADAFGWLYLGSAALKRFVDEGQPERDLPYVQWACAHAQYEIQTALMGVVRNLPNRPAAMLLRAMIFPTGARLTPPSDRLASKVAKGLLEDGEARKHLTSHIYIPREGEEGLGKLEETLQIVVKAHAVQSKVKAAVKSRTLDRKPAEDLNQRALAAGIITADELELLEQADQARAEAVAVDAFWPEDKARAEAERTVRHSA